MKIPIALVPAPADDWISRSILCIQHPLKLRKETPGNLDKVQPGLHLHILSSSFSAANAPAAGMHLVNFSCFHFMILIVLLTETSGDVCAK